MLEKVTLGHHYFKIAMLLRERLFLNGILTNSEVWYGMKKSEIKELEALDKLLLRSILETPVTTPMEAMQLELGIMSISTLIKARRINFLHYLASRNESEMLSKFFMAQWEYPGRNDWTNQVREDLLEFGISENLRHIKSKSKQIKKLSESKSYSL